MNFSHFHPPIHRPRWWFVVSVFALGGLMMVASCRKPPPPPPPAATLPQSGVQRENQLTDMPGPLYQSQHDSEIAWQPWTLATFEEARKTRRLLFVVVALPQQPSFQRVLKAFNESLRVRAMIEENYVPVLVDGDASREIGLLIGDLCAEIKRPISVPLFLWMTPEADPVAWIPAPGRTAEAVLETFDQSNAMVSRMWAEDPKYVVDNSKIDNESRYKRFNARRSARVGSADPARDVLIALRQLNVLYDPLTRTFDEAGGLFPSGALDMLATATMVPGIESYARARSMETLEDLLDDLLKSGMFDPLDGGMFSSRNGSQWSFPTFVQDSATMGRAVAALIRAGQATGNPLALERSLAVIRSVESRGLLADGAFSLGVVDELNPLDWMWTADDLREVLKPEDAEWWMKMVEATELGNLSSELDPSRKYFRLNVLQMPDRGDWDAAMNLRFDANAKLVLAARTKRMAKAVEAQESSSRPDASPHAVSTFRMVSAYAAAFTATGDEGFREKAVKTMNAARENFARGSTLQMYPGDFPASINAGRAFLYGLAMQATLDLHEITHDDEWVIWADDLATTAAEKFTSEDILKECPDEASIVALPITDLAMMFDDSSAGLIAMAEWRMASLGRPLVKSFSELATPLPVFAVTAPVLHTDLLTAVLCREFSPRISMGADLDPSLATATAMLPLRVFQRGLPDQEGNPVKSGEIRFEPLNGDAETFTDPKVFLEPALPAAAER